MEEEAYLLACLKDPKRSNEGMRLLVRNYAARLYAAIRPMCTSHEDADEVLQRTFIKAWKGIHGFREESMLYTWLHRIALRETWSFLKREKRHLSVDIQRNLPSSSLADSNELGPNGATIQRLFLQALAILPPKQRLVFVLRHFDGLSYEELALITQTSVGSLKASFHHARTKLELHLKHQL